MLARVNQNVALHHSEHLFRMAGWIVLRIGPELQATQLVARPADFLIANRTSVAFVKERIRQCFHDSCDVLRVFFFRSLLLLKALGIIRQSFQTSLFGLALRRRQWLIVDGNQHSCHPFASFNDEFGLGSLRGSLAIREHRLCAAVACRSLLLYGAAHKFDWRLRGLVSRERTDGT